MRKLVVLLVMVLICATAFPQSKTKVNAIKTPTGYTAIPKLMKATAHDSLTGLTYTDHAGKTSPVFKGGKRAHYVIRKSAKTGKTYRMYLKSK